MSSFREAIVSAAIRAPSGDNCQPWFFRFENDKKLHVDIITERAKSFFDFELRGTFLSVGAVIENIRVQAANLGFRIDVLYSGGSNPGNSAASIHFELDRSIRVSDSRLKAMLNRTVNRRLFSPIPISAKKIQNILNCQLEQTHIRVFETRKEISNLARIIYLADRIRYSHPIIHKELFDKIVFSEQAKNKRYGLEIDRLGIGPFANVVLRNLKPWKNMEKFSHFGGVTLLAGHSRLLALSSAALVLVKIPNNLPESWMRAGEQVERLWINAAEQELEVHPMTVSLYLDQRFQAENISNFLPIHKPFLEENRYLLDKILCGEVGTMLFRLGRGIPLRKPAIRMFPEKFCSDL